MQPPIPVGTILQNRYRIINILGQGGFGRTYLAEDQRRFNEPCAIKELIPATTGTSAGLQKAEELFQREAVTLYQIEHPQIPQFRERFEQDQRLFLVQDYVAGKTYRALLEERKAVGNVFTEAEVLQLILSLLPVLEYLHGRNIIHRDISPENVICRESDSKPVLIDFGVVKELATKLQSLGSTQQLTSVGKLGYAPSEQMQTGRAYPNSDLFALAVTAIVLLTGREPQDLYDENQATWDWQRLVRVNPRFAQILNRMLNFIPSNRFQTASEVAQTLQLINQPNAVSNTVNPNLSNLQTIAVGRRPDPIPEPTTPNQPDPVIPTPSSRSVLDSPLAVGAIGAAVVVLAGFGSWAVVSSIRNQPRQQAVQTPPQSFPSPVISEGATLTPTPTPTATAEPVVYSKRLFFGGSNIADIRGKLRANETIQYTFQGDEGQQLTATLAQQGEVLLTVLAPNREPIDGIAREVASYQGTLPFTGKYIIQLTPAPGLTETDYNLTVGLEKPVTPTPTQTRLEPTPTATAIPTPTPTPTPSVEVPTSQFPTAKPTTKPTQQFPTQTIPNQQLRTPTDNSNNLSPILTPSPNPTPLQTP
jgi:serine/threonine protein kinase